MHTWTVVCSQVAAVTRRVGQIWDHHTDTCCRAEAASPRWRLAALRAQWRAWTRVWRLPQPPTQEKTSHLTPAGLPTFIILVVFLAAPIARQPPPHACQFSVSTRDDGGRGIFYARALLSSHAFSELIESRTRFVFHGKVVHAGRQVVPSELHSQLKLPSFFLLFASFRMQLVPPMNNELRKLC